jgi:dTDP-4-dehydrorhamnose 3,5-epimerase
MIITPTKFPDVIVIEPDVYRDDRGYFFETFNANKFKDAVGDFNIMQCNQSKSKHRVLRGLHYQKPPFTQGKLVEVIKGEVLDVIVDIRTDSPTFGQYFSIMLSGGNKKMLFIPRGFAHGFVTLSKHAIFQYCVDNQYSPEHESGIRFDDKHLNIDWKFKKHLIVSSKDYLLKGFEEQIFFTKSEYYEIIK